MSLNQSIVEDAALEWFGEVSDAVGHGPHLAPCCTLLRRRITPQPVRILRQGECPRLEDGLRLCQSNLRDALPNASFICFTAAPIEQNDANTRAAFGEYVSVYDIPQAVIDKATLPIDYESRIAKLSLNEAELPKVDSEFEEINAGKEEDRQQKLKTKWAALEAFVDSGNIIAAGNQLNALKNEISAKVKPGSLTLEDATLANSLIYALYDSMTS